MIRLVFGQTEVIDAAESLGWMDTVASLEEYHEAADSALESVAHSIRLWMKRNGIKGVLSYDVPSRYDYGFSYSGDKEEDVKNKIFAVVRPFDRTAQGDNQAQHFRIHIPGVLSTNTTAYSNTQALAQSLYSAFQTRNEFLWHGKRYEGEIGLKALINDITSHPLFFEYVQALPGTVGEPVEIDLPVSEPSHRDETDSESAPDLGGEVEELPGIGEDMESSASLKKESVELYRGQRFETYSRLLAAEVGKDLGTDPTVIPPGTLVEVLDVVDDGNKIRFWTPRFETDRTNQFYTLLDNFEHATAQQEEFDLDDIPVMDKYKKQDVIDNLLDQWEQNPDKRDDIEMRLRELTAHLSSMERKVFSAMPPYGVESLAFSRSLLDKMKDDDYLKDLIINVYYKDEDADSSIRGPKLVKYIAAKYGIDIPDDFDDNTLEGVFFRIVNALENQRSVEKFEKEKKEQERAEKATPEFVEDIKFADPDQEFDKLITLKDQGVITDEEFNERSRRLFGSLMVKWAKKKKNPEYEKESEKINENKKKPEAKKPHDFKPAKWTHPNGHPRCLVCGGEELIGGRCNVTPSKKDQEDFQKELDEEFDKLSWLVYAYEPSDSPQVFSGEGWNPERWESDRGAAPGEPIMFLDRSTDSEEDDSVAAIVEVEDPKLGWYFEVRFPGGESLPNPTPAANYPPTAFLTAEEAAQAVESEFPQ